MRNLQEEFESEKRALLATAEEQARTIDSQNALIATLQHNLKQIGLEGQVPDMAELTSSKLLGETTTKLVALGENEIALELKQCQLLNGHEGAIFALAQFSNFKPVPTGVVSGGLTDFHFKHNYTITVAGEDYNIGQARQFQNFACEKSSH